MEKNKKFKYDGRSRPTDDTYRKRWKEIFDKGVINNETTLGDLTEVLKEQDELKESYKQSLKNKQERDLFLKNTNDQAIMTRPIWKLLNKLEMFKDCPSSELTNANWLEDRVVNITSSVRL